MEDHLTTASDENKDFDTAESGSSSQEETSSSQSNADHKFSCQNNDDGFEFASCDFRDISFSEIKILGVIGRGAYGVVQKALWGNKIVAVKMIESEIEKKAFLVEVRQLSRVGHENIVKLFGACTKGKICLVMEYAQHGSLYDVLHVKREGKPRPAYRAGHAMSWCLQCAKGVDYLHSLKPKPLVHRDLKPPNLLLYDKGRHLKICDFGTACDLHTYMTNNKGSAAWMAPEVFEGSKYSEKCDVFSWGIILWEAITRRKPFDDIGGPAFRIMWAVHNGQRPPLIAGCPKQLEVLMTRCWDRDPEQRPSMNGIVKLMTYLSKFFTGADEPVNCMGDEGTSTPLAVPAPDSVFSLITPTLIPAYPLEGEEVPVLDLPQVTTPIVVQDDPLVPVSRSMDDLDLLESKSGQKIQTPGKGHRRTGSYDPELIVKKQSVDTKQQDASPRKFFQPSLPDSVPFDRPKHLPIKTPYAPVFERHEYNGKIARDSSLEDSLRIPCVYLCLQQHLQPLSPDRRSKESVEIFKEHCQMADEYIKMQEEIRILSHRKQNLIVELDKDVKEQHQTNRLQEDYQSLLEERDRLRKLHEGLKQELEQLRRGRH